MSFFFERDAKLYVSNVTSGWSSANTDKVPLKADFAFSSETVLSSYGRSTLKENESRAIQHYSARQPLINFNFSTYVNPVQLTNVESTDRYLWEALGTYTPGATFAEVDFTSTNVAKSKELTLWVEFSDTVYRLNNCVVTTAEVVGKINDLTHIVWTGKASSITNVGKVSIASSELTFNTYIKNKLSTIDLILDSITYDIPITNYNITIRNNIAHIYRKKIGKIEEVTGHYTGTRTIDGDISAYLKIGSNKSVELFDKLRQISANLEENKASLTIHAGNTADTHSDFIMPNTVLEIPSQQFTDLITLRIPFFALESQKSVADELTVRYYI